MNTKDQLFHKIVSLLHDFRCLIQQDRSSQNYYVGQGKVVYFLHHHGQIYQNQLAELTQVKPGSLTQTLERMEKGGLIDRHRSEHDRRRIEVQLTTKGEQLYRQLDSHRQEFTDYLLAGLSVNELQELTTILQKLRDRGESFRQEKHIRDRGRADD